MPPRLLRTLPRLSFPSAITTATTTKGLDNNTNFLLLPFSKRNHAAAASFSTTAANRYAAAAGREPTYYEILNVPVTASAAEIKKSFYALSLTHHPDHNRSDPTASARFADISSAYQVLGNSAKRARYDREHGINISSANTHSSANPGQHPMGSHSSYAANLHNKGSYVGSRPASGLSKRRGQFRGPPPSFYAHGGYGATTTAKGSSRAAPGQSTSASSSASAGGKPSSSSSSGSKTEEDPTSFINNNPVWHFNAQSHYRTQSAEDIRRRRRKSREMGLYDRDTGGGGGGGGRGAGLSDSGGLIVRFVIVCGILLGAGAVAGLSQGRGGAEGSSSSNTARSSSRASSRQ